MHFGLWNGRFVYTPWAEKKQHIYSREVRINLGIYSQRMKSVPETLDSLVYKFSHPFRIHHERMRKYYKAKPITDQ